MLDHSVEITTFPAVEYHGTVALADSYDPDRLLDTLIDKLGLKNDAALSRALDVAPPVISKIRHRKIRIGASILIAMHEASELSIRQLKALGGIANLRGDIPNEC
jgi:hypothetical protein